MSIVRFTDSTNHDWRDLNRDGKVSPGEFARWTAVLCVGAWFLLQAAYAGICGLFHVEWADAWEFYKGAWIWLTLFLCAGGGFGFFIWRMLHPEKSERQTRAALKHQHKMQKWERKKAKLEIQRMQGVDEHEPGTRFGQGDVDAMAELMIRRYYDSKPWSRSALEKESYPQDLWNQANTLLKSRGIRGKGSRLKPDTYDEAWQLFVRGKRTRPNQYDWRHDEKLETS